MRVKRLTGALYLAAAWAFPAEPGHAERLAAQAPTVFGDVRGRWENWDDSADGFSGFSASARVAVEAPVGPDAVALAEVEYISEDHTAGAAAGAGLSLSRAQLGVLLAPVRLTVGRQAIAIDDERFFGPSAFRNDPRAFDAVGVTAQGDAIGFEAYSIWRVPDRGGFLTGDHDLTGSAALIRLVARTPAGWLSAFHYDLDLEGPFAPAGSQSATSGLGLEGQRRFGASMGGVWVAWRLEAARQTGKLDALAAEADFARVHLSFEGSRTGLTVGQETLGASDGFAFQTPFASKRGFQGFAGQFSTTPTEGVRDSFLEGRARFGNAWFVSNVTGFVRAHHFEDGQGKVALGREVNLGLAGSIGAQRLSVDYAAYEARAFGAETRRLWVTFARRF